MSEASVVDKSVFAFLNGLSKRIYFGEEGLTDDFLRSEVLGVSEEGKCVNGPWENGRIATLLAALPTLTIFL